MAKIVQAEHSIGGVFGHNYWVLLDDNGNVLDQIHGFAKDSAGNLTTSALGGTVFVVSGVNLDYSPSVPQATAAEGTTAEMYKLWNAALDCKVAINDKNVPYEGFPLQ